MPRKVIYPVPGASRFENHWRKETIDGFFVLFGFTCTCFLLNSYSNFRSNIHEDDLPYARILEGLCVLLVLTLLGTSHSVSTQIGFWCQKKKSKKELLLLQDEYEGLSEDDKKIFMAKGLTKDQTTDLKFICPMTWEIIVDPVEITVLRGTRFEREIHERSSITKFLDEQERLNHYVFYDANSNYIVELPSDLSTQKVKVKFLNAATRTIEPAIVTKEWIQHLQISLQSWRFSLLYSPSKSLMIDTNISKPITLRQEHAKFIKKLEATLKAVREKNMTPSLVKITLN